MTNDTSEISGKTMKIGDAEIIISTEPPCGNEIDPRPVPETMKGVGLGVLVATGLRVTVGVRVAVRLGKGVRV
jgi:hypothetical protein